MIPMIGRNAFSMDEIFYEANVNHLVRCWNPHWQMQNMTNKLNDASIECIDDRVSGHFKMKYSWYQSLCLDLVLLICPTELVHFRKMYRFQSTTQEHLGSNALNLNFPFFQDFSIYSWPLFHFFQSIFGAFFQIAFRCTFAFLAKLNFVPSRISS